MSASGKTEVRCILCGSVLATYIELEQHLEAHRDKGAEGLPVTAGDRSHKCTLCGAMFGRPEELRDHNASRHRL